MFISCTYVSILCCTLCHLYLSYKSRREEIKYMYVCTKKFSFCLRFYSIYLANIMKRKLLFT